MERLAAIHTLRALRASALLALAVWTAGAAPFAMLDAQELPSGVTTELVNRALAQEIEAPAPVPLRRSFDVTEAMAWFAIGLSILVLTVGFVRGTTREHTDSDEAGADEAAPAAVGIGTVAQRERRPERHTVERATRASDPRSGDLRRSGERAAPREALRLPPHVADILARAAAKQAHGAHPTEPSDAASVPEPEPDAPETNEGLDFVVPAYDPWKGDS